jgi:hypothetical protein
MRWCLGSWVLNPTRLVKVGRPKKHFLAARHRLGVRPQHALRLETGPAAPSRSVLLLGCAKCGAARALLAEIDPQPEVLAVGPQ